MRHAKLIVVLMTLVVPMIAYAQADTLYVTPYLIESSDPITRALTTNKGHASTTIEGNGEAVQIGYSSNQPLEIYLVPLKPDTSFVPTDFVGLRLPAATRQEAVIDLTVSPGWSPKPLSYLIYILSPDLQADAGFYSVEFVPASTISIARAAWRHLFTPELYTPSSYHALRGYRMFAVQVTVVLGIAVVILGLGLLFFKKRFNGPRTALIVLVAALLVYSARMSVDLVRFSIEHVREYYTAGTYDEAGSIHVIAQVVTDKYTQASNPQFSVYICRDGTNFKEKLLRYFAYPATVSAEAPATQTASLVLVMNKIEWSFTP